MKLIRHYELEMTDTITFKTPSGKEVRFRKVKHGEWIKICKYDNDSPVQCSVCLMDFDYIDGIGYLTDKELPNFCPNCGADMRGEKG